MWKYLNKKSNVLVLIGAICFVLLASIQCERDPDLAERELFIYLAACPVSLSQCRSNCNVSADTNGNGIIEGVEEQIFNVCNQDCQFACSQIFLFYLLTDEGN